MNVTSAAIPTAPSTPTLLPHEMQVARIGKGTVRSEIDRAIRLRFEGTGPVAQRTIVPDSAAAVDLYMKGKGDVLERAVRGFSSVIDAHRGKENLKTITFLPDEHASKAISVL